MSNDKSRGQRIDILVYEVCRADGIREIRLFPEEQAEKDGGAAAIEAHYSENAMCFYPLGKIRGVAMKTENCPLTGNASLD